MLLGSCLRLDVSYHAGQSVKSLRVKVQHGLKLVLGHHEAVVQTATWTWNLEDSRRGICVALTEWVRNLTSLGFSTARQPGWIRLAIAACLSSKQTYINLSKKQNIKPNLRRASGRTRLRIVRRVRSRGRRHVAQRDHVGAPCGVEIMFSSVGKRKYTSAKGREDKSQLICHPTFKVVSCVPLNNVD